VSALRRHAAAHLLGITLLLACVASAAQPVVGEAVFARGAVTATRGADVFLIGNGTPILEGDVITTAGRSFALLGFRDGSRVTLRPDSVFRVERFAHGGQEESSLMRLFKGGLRAVTGLVAARNPDGFRLQTAVATIGIRGTDFTARLCTDDCAREAARYAEAPGGPAAALPAGRVAFVSGSLEATLEGRSRRLVAGGAFFEGDLLETGPATVAVLAFRDEARVTLQPQSRFRIDRYQYNERSPETGSTLMSLLRGGLRAITGVVGRRAPQGYRVTTPLATIGIRGTAFDLVCQDECAREGLTAAQPESFPARLSRMFSVVPAAVAQAPSGSGLFILPREGTLSVEMPGVPDPIVVGAGQNVFIPGDLRGHVLGPEIPPAILNLLDSVPRPETVPLPPGLFDSSPVSDVPPGLYVSVLDEGHASVESAADGSVRDISRGEALYVGEQEIVRLEEGPPEFVRQDPYNAIDPRLDPTTTPVPDPDATLLECRV
jgi:hypothetical protein